MQSRQLVHLVGLMAVGAAVFLAGNAAHAATWTYAQGGWAGGAEVTGYFSGEDTDHDGWILGYEVTDFSFTFSGNDTVGAFTSSFATGGGFGNLAYRLGSGTFDPLPYDGLNVVCEVGSGDGWRTLRYVSFSEAWGHPQAPGLIMDFMTDEVLASTSQSIAVTAAVPEPGTWGLMLAGLGGLAAMRRRRR